MVLAARSNQAARRACVHPLAGRDRSHAPLARARALRPDDRRGDGPRLPRGEGQHIFSCGGTGTGKTTSALRVVAARALHDQSAVLAIDQKGDEQAEQMLRDIAAAADARSS